MRAYGAAAVVLLVACSRSPECFEYHAGLSVLPTFEVGVSYRGWLGINSNIRCLPAPMTVRGSVVDERNELVPSTWTMSHETGDARAEFGFTPLSEGPFHVTAQFDPNLATLQVDVAAARPLELRKLMELPLPADTAHCGNGVVFADGTLACANPIGTSANVYFDGGITDVMALDGQWQRMLRGGNAVWFIADRQLQRRMPVHGRLAVTHQTVAGGTTPLAATEASLFAVEITGEHLVRYDAVDGGTLAKSYVNVKVPDAHSGAMTRDGQALWSVGRQICLTASSGLWQRCVDATPVFSYVEPDGVWLGGFAGVTFFDVDMVQHDAQMPSLYSGAPLAAQDGIEMLYVRPAGPGLRFERFPEGPVNGTIDGDRLVMFQPGKVTIYER